ncbi:MAG: dihydroorotate dehydrogenase electron transfer subunit [Lactovum sp.]
MDLFTLTVLSHQKIAKETYQLKLERPKDILLQAGQFAMLKIEGKFLKRPLSISDYNQDSITFIYKILGEGTALLSKQNPTEIEALLPLGKAFPLSSKAATLIAGGVGIAPMTALARELYQLGTPLEIFLGYKCKEEIFSINELKQYGKVTYYTEDGSAGKKGYCLPDDLDCNRLIYACGPHPMLHAIAKKYSNQGWLSTEEYMACGFGICAGCVISLKSGLKKVCVDGPVFAIEEFK